MNHHVSPRLAECQSAKPFQKRLHTMRAIKKRENEATGPGPQIPIMCVTSIWRDYTGYSKRVRRLAAAQGGRFFKSDGLTAQSLRLLCRSPKVVLRSTMLRTPWSGRKLDARNPGPRIRSRSPGSLRTDIAAVHVRPTRSGQTQNSPRPSRTRSATMLILLVPSR